jgi:hypothetical protein
MGGGERKRARKRARKRNATPLLVFRQRVSTNQGGQAPTAEGRRREKWSEKESEKECL